MSKYIIEFIGAFFLVFTIALTGNPLPIGAVLIALVYMGGYISGAHYNPAVTLAVLIRGKIKALVALGYMLAQVLGGMAAALTFMAVKHEAFIPKPGAGVAVSSAFTVELLFTFLLASVVLHVATSVGTEDNQYFGAAIGLTVMAAAFAGGAISGGVYNPAVALGPMLVDTAHLSANGSVLGMYLLATFAGGALAGVVFNLVSGNKIVNREK